MNKRDALVPNPAANLVGIRKGVFVMKMKRVLFMGLTLCLLGLSMFASSASATELGNRVLYTGMAGADVKQVQEQLIRLGYPTGEGDGVYGKNTQAAVIAFQQANKLNADGIVGRETLNVLRGDQVAEVSRGKVPERYKQAHNIVATAYAPGFEDNGKWGNLTHIGTQVRPGIIAVDPRVIPLGSRVYIEFPDGQGMYAVAEDTGGAIKGNRIDIAFQTRDQAKDFGIQNTKVFVLS